MEFFRPGLIRHSDQYTIGAAYWLIPAFTIKFEDISMGMSSTPLPCTIFINRDTGLMSLSSAIYVTLTQQPDPKLEDLGPIDLWASHSVQVPLNNIQNCQMTPHGQARIVEVTTGPEHPVHIDLSATYIFPGGPKTENVGGSSNERPNFNFDCGGWSDDDINILLAAMKRV